jgi:hypothetical protein
MHPRARPSVVAALAAAMAALPGAGAAAGEEGGAGTLEPIVVSDAPGGARQPSVAVDAKGGVHVAFVAGGKVLLASRSAGELSFAERTVAAAAGAACGMRRGPRVAACAGALVVSWIESRFDPEKKVVVGSRNLVASRSADGGRTWSPPSPVNRRKAACGEGLHALAAGPGNALYAAWLQPAEEGKKGAVIRLARSGDAGATWAGECTVYASPSGTVCECCHPSVAVGPDGAVAVMFRNFLEGARDMFVARSPDQGRTFEPARRLGRGTWPLKGCPMDGGGLAFGPGGVLFTAWRRETTVFLTGAGDAEEEAGPGSQPWAGGVPGGATFAAWTGPEGDLLAASLGTPARELRRLPAGGERCVDPVVAGSASGVVFAAWERVPGDPARTRVEGAYLKSAPPAK